MNRFLLFIILIVSAVSLNSFDNYDSGATPSFFEPVELEVPVEIVKDDFYDSVDNNLGAVPPVVFDPVFEPVESSMPLESIVKDSDRSVEDISGQLRACKLELAGLKMRAGHSMLAG